MSNSSDVPPIKALLVRLEEREWRIETLETWVNFLLERREVSDALKARQNRQLRSMVAKDLADLLEIAQHR